MKIFKNTVNFILVLSMVLTFSIPAFSKEINQITENNVSSKVIQIIDGDTIKVQLPNKDTAYVKLKGIDAKGFDASYDYLSSSLLGENVTLVNDGSSYKGGKFNYMVVYHNGKNINKEMVQNGYALIDSKQDKGGTYTSLLASQEDAKDSLLGMWRFNDKNYSSIIGSSNANILQTNDKVNINTATREQLEKLLKGVSSNLSREIIKYSEKNPFSNIQEIKFVKGFTKKIYDENKHRLTVCTNINIANEFELKTLNNMSDANIKKILDKRTKKDFSSLSQLIGIISRNEYDKISDFISLEDKASINISKPYNIANISLSNKATLTNANVPYYFADDVISYRKNGYTYKTLMELSKLGSKNIMEEDIHYLEDNLNVFVNLNTDNINELTSIFDKKTAEKIKNKTFYNKSDLKDVISLTDYDKVKDCVYVNKNQDVYVNINTATKEQMYEQKIPTNEAYHLINARPIRNASQLPLNVSSINNKITLYTNINTASKTELISLNNGIDSMLIDKIIKYREEDNFGSLEEVEQFFRDNKASHIYDKIKSYIVIR